MRSIHRYYFHWRQATAVALLGTILATARPMAAAEPAPTGAGALTALISRLGEQGVLSKADAADLLLLAEADAAEVRAQAAAVQAAEARAQAAEARARALAAMVGRRGAAAPERAVETRAADTARALDTARETEQAVAEALARRRQVAPPEPIEPRDPVELSEPREPRRGRTVREPVAEAEPETEVEPVVEAPRVRRPARSAGPAQAIDEPVQTAAAEPAETAPGDDTVRVTYVPEFVKQQIREQVKQEVLDEAREEGWATPRAVPDWVSRLRFFGDVRFRFEGQRFPADNDLGGYLNFNALNTGAAFDVTDQLKTPFPYYNADQDRNRLRLRARLGTAFDLGEGFAGGLRLATGESNSPVTQNQSLGAAGSGQGGNFSKYAVWLDRAFLRWETGGLPDQDLVASFGRFDNPFLSTSMLWADDLGFDGFEAHGRYGLGEDITTFFTLGAFPVFNTDLNFASNRIQKSKSDDKWLYAAQLGAAFDLGSAISVKLAAAYYPYSNIEGRFSTPFTPFSAADPGDTDATRPAFAQKGNTYMPLRDILPTAANGQGTTLQFQYFGLASQFRPLVGDLRVEFNHFQPFQLVLSAEYVKNLAFDADALALLAVNNLGAAPATGGAQPFLGSGTAWTTALTLGDAALQKRWDWNVSIGYRKVGSDALVDGFADSDFGGGGTNVKGLTLGGSLALSSRVSLGLRWMSATEVAGPRLKSDIFQLDLNGRY